MTALPEIDWNDIEPPADIGTTGARRSWRPVDLAAVLAGQYEPLVPTVGSRDDGAGLLYRGRQHTVVGESEALKSWFAQVIAVTELNDGNGVLYLDFEDDEGAVVPRLLALGATRDAIRDRFAYLRPEEPVGALGNVNDLIQALGDVQPTYAVLDGITEAMTMHGLDPLNNKDVATFGRLLPRHIAASGPAVLSLDHVTKDREGRGRYALGAVHKLNAVDGAAFVLENRAAFGIRRTGRSTVLVAKDRPGQLRAYAQPSAGNLHWFADLVLISRDEVMVEASLEPPVERTEDFRPTVLMGRVAEALTRTPDPLSVRDVLDRVTGKQEATRKALACLIDEGFVVVDNGPRGARLHRLVKPFTREEF